MALKKAEKNIAYCKIGIYGDAGSGKTRTAAEIAIGLIKSNGLKPIVAMYDTEPAHQFIQPLFEKEGIDLLVEDKVSRSFVSLMGFMKEAIEESSVIIVDSITHVWQELQKAHLDKINEGRKKYNKYPLQKLHHWGAIKEEWRKFTDLFLTCKAHVIVCGRAGSIYEYQENEETGKKELITAGTKMATEKEMGYEPSLLIEMQKIRDKSSGRLVNTAFIEKDRADKINGDLIPFPNFEKLRPHFDFINLGGNHFEMKNDNSQNLFDEEGRDETYRNKREAEFLLGEIKEILESISGGTSNEAKEKRRRLIAKHNNGCLSWSSVEQLNLFDLRYLHAEMKKELESASGKIENSEPEKNEGKKSKKPEPIKNKPNINPEFAKTLIEYGVPNKELQEWIRKITGMDFISDDIALTITNLVKGLRAIGIKPDNMKNWLISNTGRDSGYDHDELISLAELANDIPDKP